MRIGMFKCSLIPRMRVFSEKTKQYETKMPENSDNKNRLEDLEPLEWGREWGWAGCGRFGVELDSFSFQIYREECTHTRASKPPDASEKRGRQSRPFSHARDQLRFSRVLLDSSIH